jgi:hypothetical protein
MTILRERQLVNFDEENPIHRQSYYEFLRDSKWSRTAPRFVLEQTYSSVPQMIQERLMSFYLQKEFCKKKPALKYDPIEVEPVTQYG